MAKVQLDTPAFDFTAQDVRGQEIRLADFYGQQHVVLVFNRGFI